MPPVAFDQWARTEVADRGRAKRLATSYVAAATLVAAILAAGVAFGGQIKQRVLEEEVTVQFVPPPEPAKPPPPPPPPPPPRPKVASAAPPPPLGAKRDAVPLEIPKSKPDEADPAHALAEVPFGEGDPNGVVGGTGKPGGGGAAPAPTVVAPAPVLRAYQIAEVTTAPAAVTRSMPAYPEEARRAGVDMVVVVKLVVTETGGVEDVKILEGHPLLDRAVIDAVRTWRFTPGTLDGKPVRVVRKLKFPFHLRVAN